jgi:CheY-like chemotaxis protein
VLPSLGRRAVPLVLCVDDDATARTLTRLAIVAAGFDVAEAANGREAIEVFEKSRPDLVLLDVHMEDVDGFEVCAAIRGSAHGREVPVVMLTGDDDTDTIRKAWYLTLTFGRDTSVAVRKVAPAIEHRSAAAQLSLPIAEGCYSLCPGVTLIPTEVKTASIAGDCMR